MKSMQTGFYALILVACIPVATTVAQERKLSKASPIKEARADNTTNVIDYSRYLSQSDRADIVTRLAKAEARRRIRNGIPFSTEDVPVEISIPIQLIPESELEPTMEDSPSIANLVPVGNLTCTIDTQTPHRGSGPNSSFVPKAKTAGNCSLIYSGPGQLPQYLDWDLTMALVRLPTNPYGTGTRTWSDSHLRRNLNPRWNNSTAQVFGDCYSGGGTFIHFDYIYITPPPGYVYTGENPLSVGEPKSNYINCD